MIDLSDYTPKKRIFLKSQGVRAIYIVGPESGKYSKVGVASDIVARMVTMQTGNWQRLGVHYLLWCPGAPVAQRLEKLSHEILAKAGKRLVGEWFSVAPEWALKTVNWVVREHYPTVRLLTHEEQIEKLRRKPIDRRDHLTLPNLQDSPCNIQ